MTWRRLPTNHRPDLLKVGQRVATDFPGYRMEGVIATVRPDSLCGSGIRVSLEKPEPCPTCSRETEIVKSYPNLFSPFNSPAPVGVDAAWFHPLEQDNKETGKD